MILLVNLNFLVLYIFPTLIDRHKFHSTIRILINGPAKSVIIFTFNVERKK